MNAGVGDTEPCFFIGDVAERLKAAVLKTVGGGSRPQVRILPSPPFPKFHSKEEILWRTYSGAAKAAAIARTHARWTNPCRAHPIVKTSRRTEAFQPHVQPARCFNFTYMI